MATIGKLSVIPWERDFEWSIKDFSSLSAEVGKYYHSPLFYFANASWYLRIYPNGEKSNDSTGYIGLYLMRKCSGSPISLDYSLILKTGDQRTDREEELSSHVFEKADNGRGWPKFKERSKFLEGKCLPEMINVLTVICKLKKTECAGEAAFYKLSHDLKQMMLSGANSDTTVKVKDVEFQLHRNVLMARNGYFNSMFSNDMKEKSTGNVTIDDCEPDTFRTFVHFLYTGEVDKLSQDNMCELYEASDKYQDDQLKKECLDFMMKKISDDTFYDLIALALRYDEKELLEKAVEFFVSKPIEIFRDDKWQKFAKEYPTQANELILKTLTRHVK